MIYLLTIGHILRVDAEAGKENRPEKNQYFQVFPHAFMLIDHLLRHDLTREACLNAITSKYTLDQHQTKNMIGRALVWERNVDAVVRHLESLFFLELFESRWTHEICLRGLEECKENWEINIMGYLGNIVRIYISEKYLKN